MKRQNSGPKPKPKQNTQRKKPKKLDPDFIPTVDTNLEDNCEEPSDFQPQDDISEQDYEISTSRKSSRSSKSSQKKFTKKPKSFKVVKLSKKKTSSSKKKTSSVSRKKKATKSDSSSNEYDPDAIFELADLADGDEEDSLQQQAIQPAPSSDQPRVPSLREKLKAFEQKTSQSRKRAKAAQLEGWAPFKDKFVKFTLTPAPANAEEFTITTVTNDTSLLDIFTTQFPFEFAHQIVTKRLEESPTTLPMPTLVDVIRYLAFRVRIQGLHEVPIEGKGRTQKQRAAFRKAQQHFFHKFNVNLAINMVESIHSHFFFDRNTDEATQVNGFIQRLVVKLGDHMSGDEKLYSFRGRFPWVRRKRDGALGIWFYTLCGKLPNGLPFQIYARPHTAIKDDGESIPVHEIVSDWARIISNYGTPNFTILCFDSYYTTRQSLQVLRDANVLYCAAIQEHRFQTEAKLLVKPQDPNRFSMIHNEKTDEIMVYAFDKDTTIGRKYSTCNCYQLIQLYRPTKPTQIPCHSWYNFMFNLCDVFNRYLKHRCWPNRSGGGGSFGEPRRRIDFIFSSILSNVLNLYRNAHNGSENDKTFTFETVMLLLADLIFDFSMQVSESDSSSNFDPNNVDFDGFDDSNCKSDSSSNTESGFTSESDSETVSYDESEEFDEIGSVSSSDSNDFEIGSLSSKSDRSSNSLEIGSLSEGDDEPFPFHRWLQNTGWLNYSCTIDCIIYCTLSCLVQSDKQILTSTPMKADHNLTFKDPNASFLEFISWLFQNDFEGSKVNLNAKRNTWRSTYCKQLLDDDKQGFCGVYLFLQGFKKSDGIFTTRHKLSFSCSQCHKQVERNDNRVEHEFPIALPKSDGSSNGTPKFEVNHVIMSCQRCSTAQSAVKMTLTEVKLEHLPLVLVVDAPGLVLLQKVRVDKMVEEFIFEGWYWKLCGIIWGNNSHFVATLNIGGVWYYYDDLEGNPTRPSKNGFKPTATRFKRLDRSFYRRVRPVDP